jgi:FixJ family two-component response regulator
MTLTTFANRALVSVVDDDVSVRESLPDLLGQFGLEAEAFASANEFLESGRLEQTQCLILDVAMPGMTGLELQLELKRRSHCIPIVFISAHVDETVHRQMIEQGASAYLPKPFGDTALIDAVMAALSSK